MTLPTTDYPCSDVCLLCVLCLLLQLSALLPGSVVQFSLPVYFAVVPLSPACVYVCCVWCLPLSLSAHRTCHCVRAQVGDANELSPLRVLLGMPLHHALLHNHCKTLGLDASWLARTGLYTHRKG